MNSLLYQAKPLTILAVFGGINMRGNAFLIALFITFVFLFHLDSFGQDNSQVSDIEISQNEVAEYQLVLSQKANADAQAEYYRKLTSKLDEKPETKIVEVFNVILPFLGLILGSGITWFITKQTKRQEWRAQVNAQLIAKRIQAYDLLIDITRRGKLMGGEVKDGEFIKYPLIISEPNVYEQWSLSFKEVTQSVLHLIDAELSNKITTFANYLAYLDERLGHWDENNDKIIEKDKLKLIGTILYEDIVKLTSDILEEAGKFYSKAIYNDSFIPSIINNQEFELPKDFNEYALFKQKNVIDELLKAQ